ncbi:MAG: hypothetical protein ABGZ53_32105 [Fuerstiella sp.]
MLCFLRVFWFEREPPMTLIDADFMWPGSAFLAVLIGWRDDMLLLQGR